MVESGARCVISALCGHYPRFVWCAVPIVHQRVVLRRHGTFECMLQATLEAPLEFVHASPALPCCLFQLPDVLLYWSCTSQQASSVDADFVLGQTLQASSLSWCSRRWMWGMMYLRRTLCGGANDFCFTELVDNRQTMMPTRCQGVKPVLPCAKHRHNIRYTATTGKLAT